MIYSTAAGIPPGLIRSSRSVSQYGCVSAGLRQMGCKYDPNGANMDRKWSSNDAQMGRGGTNGAQMGPSEVSVKLTLAQWGQNFGQMGARVAQVWPIWGPMKPNRRPNGAPWDTCGEENGSKKAFQNRLIDPFHCRLPASAISRPLCSSKKLPDRH